MASELDFGVDQSYKGLTFDDGIDDNFFGFTQTKKLVESALPPGTICNPLFADLHGGSLTTIEPKETYNFDRVLLLTWDGNKPINQLYDKFIDEATYHHLTRHLSITAAPFELIKNWTHRKQALIVEKQYLDSINRGKYSLYDEELVLCLFELKNDMVDIYTDLYSQNTDLGQILKSQLLYQVYNCRSCSFYTSFDQLLAKVKDSDYWKNPNNCDLDFSEDFKTRRFQYKEHINDATTSVIISDDKRMNELINKLAKTDYLQAMFFKRDKYTNLGTVGNKKYWVKREDCGFSKQQITQMFATLSDEKQLYNLFNSMLLSKKYCHLVLNNKDVLFKMKDIIQKFKPIYRYIFGYSWLYMYIEECITKSRITTDSRFVFDINTANSLPFFPYIHNDLHQNPYISVPISKDVLNASDNCMTVPMITNFDNYGIDTLHNFQRKFNIFTTGSVDNNIFDGLEGNTKSWSKFAVTGSCIPACAQKESPLIRILIEPTASYQDKYNRLFEEYYPDSDIDIMCKETTVIGFINEFKNLVQTVESNLKKIYGPESSVTVESDKNLAMYVHPLFISKFMSKDFDPEFVMNNFDSAEIKEWFFAQYILHKTNNNQKLRKFKKNTNNPYFENFMKLSSPDDINVALTVYEMIKKEYEFDNGNDTVLYLSDIVDEEVLPENNIMVFKISENIKFKIKSTNLRHNLEVFKIKYPDYFSCVSRFHLPCVRGYYDGGNVYMLPSCVTALMTFVNIDYKYFAGVRDPINIINKYRMRGYGTLINNAEKKKMNDYNTKTSHMNGMFQTSTTGSTDIGSEIFKPNKYVTGLPEEIYRHPVVDYVTTENDLKTMYGLDNSQIDYLAFKTINENGSINPVKDWLIQAAYDTMS